MEYCFSGLFWTTQLLDGEFVAWFPAAFPVGDPVHFWLLVPQATCLSWIACLLATVTALFRLAGPPLLTQRSRHAVQPYVAPVRTVHVQYEPDDAEVWLLPRRFPGTQNNLSLACLTKLGRDDVVNDLQG